MPKRHAISKRLVASAAVAEGSLEEEQHAPKAGAAPLRAFTGSTGFSSKRTIAEDLKHMKDVMMSLGEELHGKLERLVQIAGDAERARLKDMELTGHALERLLMVLDEAPANFTERIGAAMSQLEERKARNDLEPKLHPPIFGQDVLIRSPEKATSQLLQPTPWERQAVSGCSQQAGGRACQQPGLEACDLALGVLGQPDADMHGLPKSRRRASEADADTQQPPKSSGRPSIIGKFHLGSPSVFNMDRFILAKRSSQASEGCSGAPDSKSPIAHPDAGALDSKSSIAHLDAGAPDSKRSTWRLKAAKSIRHAGRDISGWKPAPLPRQVEQQKSRKEIVRDTMDYMSMVVILANTIFLGVEAEIRLGTAIKNEDSPEWVFWVNLMFAVVFVTELTAKIFVLRGDFIKENRYWHAFDTFLVMTAVGDIIFAYLNLSFVRTVRIFRALRAARIMRTIGYVEDLRLMVASITSALPSLSWACALLFLLLYLCALLVMQGVEAYTLTHPPDEAMIRLFGDMWTSMGSLFMSISGGIDWGDCVKPLMKVHPIYAPLWVLFVGFVSFGVIGVLTTVLIEASSGILEIDRGLVIQRNIKEEAATISHLKNLFKELTSECDGDQPNDITKEQLEKVLGRRDINALLNTFQLNVSQTKGVFHLLDVDGDGKVDADEFVTGLLRLRGPAKEVDAATILYEHKRLSDQIVGILNVLTSSQLPEWMAQSSSLPDHRPGSGRVGAAGHPDPGAG